MPKNLKEQIMAHPEMMDLPLHTISPSGFHESFESCSEFLEDNLHNDVYVSNCSVYQDLFGKDKYVVAFVSYSCNFPKEKE